MIQSAPRAPAPAPSGAVIVQPGPAQAPEAVIAVPSRRERSQPDIPERGMAVAITFFALASAVAILLPIARAFARRMDRSGTLPSRADLSPEAAERLTRIEHAVDSIALEVERISEGQRFTTKILSARPDAAIAERASDRAPGQG